MKLRSSLLIVLLLLILIISPAHAQNALSDGTTITAALTAEAPQTFYTFSGSAGDVVTVYVLGHTPDLTPTIALSENAGQLAFSDSDPLTPLTNDANVTTRLPQDGAYSLLVGSADGTAGLYTITMQVAVPVISTVLTDSVTINIPPGAPQQTYSIAANDSVPTSLTVQSQSPDFTFRAWLHNPDGQIVAAVSGGLEAATLVIPAGDGDYELTVTASDSATSGEVTISLGGATAAPAQATEETSQSNTQAADPSACTVTTNGNVNVRSGPATNYPAIDSLDSGEELIASGQNGGWYVGELNGVEGWVFSGVVEAKGHCNNLSFVEAPPAPLPTAIQTQGTTTQVTPTATQTGTTNQQPTATTAPTESAQIAPTDSNLASTYNIKSSSPQSLSGAISYPQGDTSDTIQYTITGYDSVTTRAELRWTLFCNGDSQNVTLRFGNNDVATCNDSHTRSISGSNNSGTGNASASLTIAYTGGDNVYVDWTLQLETVSCAPRDC